MTHQEARQAALDAHRTHDSIAERLSAHRAWLRPHLQAVIAGTEPLDEERILAEVPERWALADELEAADAAVRAADDALRAADEALRVAREEQDAAGRAAEGQAAATRLGELERVANDARDAADAAVALAAMARNAARRVMRVR